ncbi:MAG: hypothetical protein IPO81_25880 [Kouleothrix sp.]|nr:hypothetical protein [Kouleothrix sp.]
MIERMLDHVAALPQDLRQICESLLYIEAATGQAIPPAAMEQWVIRQFGAAAAVREQTIVTVTNRLTLESALFNPLRARRPTQPGGGDAALEKWIARELAEHDIFADPERDTTADVFGRIRGRYCVSASNVAKYAGWHGLIIFDEPHPLRFGPAQVRDYLDVALRWIAAAHALDSHAIYPIITWNCLPKSGATIMHGHMQVALARGMHYARVEGWRRAAQAYRATSGRDYFGDLAALHQALGLAIPLGGAARAFAHLTPARNREIVLLADQGLRQGDKEIRRPGDACALSPGLLISLSERLGPALYAVLRRLIDEQGMRAFNLAIALPPIGPAAEDWRDVPIVARLGDRGSPLTSRSDIGAMEIFAAGCITDDPFEVAARFHTRDTKTRRQRDEA